MSGTMRLSFHSIARRRRADVLALATVAALAACSAQQQLERMLPAEVDRDARALLASIQHGDFATAAARIPPALRGPEIDRALADLRDSLRAVPVEQFHAIGFESFQRGLGDDRVRRTGVTYEAPAWGAHWVLVSLTAIDSGGTRYFETLQLQTIPELLERTNAFTFHDKGPGNLLFLLALGLCVAFTLGTAVLVATARGMPRRGRWALLSVVGVSKITLNWTTGAVATQLFTVQLFGGGAFKAGPAAPWVVGISFPVGAALALQHWLRWPRQRDSGQHEAGSDAVPVPGTAA